MHNALILEVADRIRIALPRDVRLISTCVFLEQEDWFEDEAPFVRRVAEAGGVMLDVGASFGFYGLNYARAGGPTSRVFAFEPTPQVCEFYRESLIANCFENVTLFETAVGSAVGRVRLTASPSSEVNRIDTGTGSIDVAVTTLDVADSEYGFRGLDFVKLDVEGHELAVIQGGAKLFHRESPLVMLEVKAGDACDFAAATELEAMGYGLYRLVPQLGALIPFDRRQVDSYLLNIFACKPDRAAKLAERGLLCATLDEVAPIASFASLPSYLCSIPGLGSIRTLVEGLISRAPAGDPSLLLLQYDLASRDANLPLSARGAALAQAVSIAERMVAARSSFVRSMSAARVLRGWGARQHAVDAIRPLLGPVLNGAEVSIDAPFLPPLPSYDAPPAPAGPGAWVSAAIIEAIALWSSFSVYWGEPFAVPVADLLQRHGRATPLFERRRQLRAMMEGRQSGPLPHPLLESRTLDNLNPSYWCGRA